MDDLYKLAREVLLDALHALEPHLDALVLVGAQALYLHVGEADLAIAPYTSDGDIALDPSRLGEVPPLQAALEQAGFRRRRRGEVGVWVTSRPLASGQHVDVAVDLLVPQGVSPGKGRRAARLAGHDPLAARKVDGLEGALVDRDIVEIGDWEQEHRLPVRVQVAGPAALLCAKLIKIRDRLDSSRSRDKDALDVVRLLRGVETEPLARRMGKLLNDERSARVAAEALELLARLFGQPDGPGLRMVERAVEGVMDPAEVTAAARLLALDLLEAMNERR